MDRKKLAVVHIVKKELSLSDEEYCNILERVAGVRSSRDLTDSQFHKLMRYSVRTLHYRATSAFTYSYGWQSHNKPGRGRAFHVFYSERCSPHIT